MPPPAARSGASTRPPRCAACPRGAPRAGPPRPRSTRLPHPVARRAPGTAGPAGAARGVDGAQRLRDRRGRRSRPTPSAHGGDQAEGQHAPPARGAPTTGCALERARSTRLRRAAGRAGARSRSGVGVGETRWVAGPSPVSTAPGPIEADQVTTRSTASTPSTTAATAAADARAAPMRGNLLRCAAAGNENAAHRPPCPGATSRSGTRGGPARQRMGAKGSVPGTSARPEMPGVLLGEGELLGEVADVVGRRQRGEAEGGQRADAPCRPRSGTPSRSHRGRRGSPSRAGATSHRRPGRRRGSRRGAARAPRRRRAGWSCRRCRGRRPRRCRRCRCRSGRPRTGSTG